MNVGKKEKKSKRVYRMADTVDSYHDLEITSCKRDIGVLVSDYLKVQQQSELHALKTKKNV